MEKIVKIVFDSEFFCIFDTLECGQIFRYKQFNKGFLVFSLDKCAYCYADNKNTVIECLEEDQKYFDNFFDLQRDYKSIYNRAKEQKVKMLSNSAEYGKGIRILKQDSVEMLFSFIISQNNNIPRIKGIIEKLCVQLGEKKRFLNQEYFAFPKIDLLATQPLEFFQKIGLGYRANYIRQLAVEIKNGLDLNSFKSLSTLDLKKRLMQIYGVGAKVADCVCLFGFNRSDSFPVDTWIEKVYREDFNGQLKDREKQAKWFVDKFGLDSGYFQQYLFHYKRIIEKRS